MTIQILVLLLMPVFLWNLFAVGCPQGWTGWNCNLKCRCTNDSCLENGSCAGRHTCKYGWFGELCQFRDLLVRVGKTTPTWLQTANRTCGAGRTQAVITLRTPVHLTWMRLCFRPNISWQGNNPDLKMVLNENSSCETLKTLHLTDLVDIVCQFPDPVHTISMSGRLLLSVCEINISGGRNLALKATTSLSAVGSNNSANHPSLAVDGNLSTCVYIFSSTLAVFEIKFLRPVHLYRIIMNFYLPTPGSRFNAKLSLLTPNGSEIFTKALVSTKTHELEVPLDGPHETSGSVVFTSWSDYLELSEIETYGIALCPLGLWGLNCTHQCNCLRHDDQCEPNTGYCLTGCAASFYGPRCSVPCNPHCDSTGCEDLSGDCLACPDGFFGVLCQQTCADYCREQKCNQDRGECLHCEDGFYGPNCSLNCPTNCAAHWCTLEKGLCFVCQDGFFGPLCNRTCSPDCSSRGCDFDTGDCEISEDEMQRLGLLLLTAILAFMGIIYYLVFCYTKSSRKQRAPTSVTDNTDKRPAVQSTPSIKPQVYETDELTVIDIDSISE